MTDRREKTEVRYTYALCGSHRAGPFAAPFFPPFCAVGPQTAASDATRRSWPYASRSQLGRTRTLASSLHLGDTAVCLCHCVQLA